MYSTPWPDAAYQNLTVSGSISSSSNINLPTSTALVGNINKNGVRFITNPLGNNTFCGVSSGNLAVTGTNNSGYGFNCLPNVSTATDDTAYGVNSQIAMQSGVRNTSMGAFSLSAGVACNDNVAIGFNAGSPATGNQNTCIGAGSCDHMTAANNNVAVGYRSGSGLTTGSGNVLVGPSAAITLTTGSNNIVLGDGLGVVAAADSGKIVIGNLMSTSLQFTAGSIVSPPPGGAKALWVDPATGIIYRDA